MKRLVVSALVVMLLGACSTDGDKPTAPSPAPSSEGGDPDRASVVRRDFVASYTFDGATARSESVRFDAPEGVTLGVAGTVPRPVTRGARIGQRAVGEGSRAVPAPLRAQLAMRAGPWVGPVISPLAGVLADDGRGPRVTAPGFDVVVPVSPLQELRYRVSRYRGKASVETVFGPVTVPCVALWLEREVGAPPPVQGEDTTVDPAQLATGRLHCRLPGYLETASGLRARLTVTSATVKNALVVPAVLVGHDDSTLQPYVVTGADGMRARVPVTLGATDGVVTVVAGGLAPGDPLSPPDDAEGAPSVAPSEAP